MNERPIPWYKNHILLLIILIPLATVCGSMYTIYLAISSKEAPILDDYSKTGLSPLDQRHTLQADAPNHYPLPAAVQQTLTEATWYLSLAPADNSWKIKGKYPHPKPGEPPPPAVIPLANP